MIFRTRVAWTLWRMMRYPRQYMPWYRRVRLDARDALLRLRVTCRRFRVFEAAEGFAVYDTVERRVVASWFPTRTEPDQIALALNAVEQEGAAW